MPGIVWKFFQYSLHFQWWFKFLEKVLIWLRKCWFYLKKMPKSKVESFRKANFDVSQECKIMPTWTIKFGTSTQLTCLKTEELNVLNIWKMWKKWSLKEARPSFDQNSCSSTNPVQNIWNKIEKSSKIVQD